MSGARQAWTWAVLLSWSLACTAHALTLEQAVSSYPKEVAALVAAIDGELPGLEAFAAARDAGDSVTACRALLDYYRQRRAPAKTGREPDRAFPAAEDVLQDRYTVQGVTGTLPRLEHGGLDWTYQGPKNDSEWAWGVNRFGHFDALLDAYVATGDERYAKRISDELTGWVAASPYPGHRSSSAQWRGLEIALRLRPWARAFHLLQYEPAFSEGARVLMLSTLPDHADYLIRFPGYNNWITMEMNGLARLATTWPEFAQSDAWIEHSLKVLTPELSKQVYPDGVQKELTSHYHRVALVNFESYARLLRDAGRPVPDEFSLTLEKMWSYLALTMRPSGYGLLNNDSDLDYNRDPIIQAARTYDRPDWLYVATNGQQGEPPRHRHAYFGWAGHALMRSGYDADARWSFFDAGPLGIAHAHADRLHLSVSAFGRDLLVDGGRYTYVRGRARDYYMSSYAHNTVCFSGEQQQFVTPSVKKPHRGQFETGKAYAYAIGEYREDYGRLEALSFHTRAVVYFSEEDFWIVVDKLYSDREQTVRALWHFHPECDVALDGVQAYTRHEGKGHLRMVPAGPVHWRPEIVKGQTKPRVQGWYSPRYNTQTPAACVEYHGKIGWENTWFAWVLMPGEQPIPSFASKLERLSEDTVAITVGRPEGPDFHVQIDTLLNGGGRPRVRFDSTD